MKILNNKIANSIGIPLDAYLWNIPYTQLEENLRNRLISKIRAQLHDQLYWTLANQLNNPLELRVNFNSNHGE